LTLTRSLVELHGGRIVAESKGDRHGLAFRIWLPRSIASGHSRATGISEPTKKQAFGQNNEIRPLHTCVVEDLDDSRNLMKTLLELDGHRVTTASDGTSAIDTLTNDPPDFALVDMGLPDISGYEVVRQVRQRLPNMKLKLIALTGFGQTSDVAQAIEAGFDAHIVNLSIRQSCKSFASKWVIASPQINHHLSLSLKATPRIAMAETTIDTPPRRAV
jgi:two-component system CheB/CheR fusion protein